MKHLLCLALVVSPLGSLASSPATTPAAAKPGTALDRLKALNLAVSKSKDEIASSKTEEEVLGALQNMEKRFANLNQIKSEKPESEPEMDKAEFLKNLPDIPGLQKEFAQSIDKFENITLVSSQLNHALRLHVYGRAMRSLTPEQVKQGIQQEFDILEASTKLFRSSVSVLEKSAADLAGSSAGSEAREKAREQILSQLVSSKHQLELTESSINYLNKALTHPWFNEAQNAE